MVLFVVSSVLVSCSRDNEIINSVNQNVESRKCKNCGAAVAADFAGVLSGVPTGAWWGGLFGPHGAVIGGMIGGVVGCVAGSVGAGRANGDFPIYLNVPLAPVNDNSINNPFDNYGILHNQLLNKYLKGDLIGENLYNELYLDAVNYQLSNDSSMTSANFDINTFKTNFFNQFTSCYSGNFQTSSYYLSVKQIYFSTIFNSNDLEEFIRQELLKDLSDEELFGLAVLRHTHYFWNS